MLIDTDAGRGVSRRAEPADQRRLLDHQRDRRRVLRHPAVPVPPARVHGRRLRARRRRDQPALGGSRVGRPVEPDGHQGDRLDPSSSSPTRAADRAVVPRRRRRAAIPPGRAGLAPAAERERVLLPADLRAGRLPLEGRRSRRAGDQGPAADGGGRRPQPDADREAGRGEPIEDAEPTAPGPDLEPRVRDVRRRTRRSSRSQRGAAGRVHGSPIEDSASSTPSAASTRASRWSPTHPRPSPASASSRGGDGHGQVPGERRCRGPRPGADQEPAVRAEQRLGRVATEGRAARTRSWTSTAGRTTPPGISGSPRAPTTRRRRDMRSCTATFAGCTGPG